MADKVIAQINIARMLAPIDDPVMAHFVARLDEINGLGEHSPGFIWLLKGAGNEAPSLSLRVFDDQYVIVNMSVWESIDALHQFTYYSAHAEVYRQRNDWFSKLEQAGVALWWVDRDHIPTPQEGKERLEHLRQHGPTPTAFTFKQRFPPPAQF